MRERNGKAGKDVLFNLISTIFVKEKEKKNISFLSKPSCLYFSASSLFLHFTCHSAIFITCTHSSSMTTLLLFSTSRKSSQNCVSRIRHNGTNNGTNDQDLISTCSPKHVSFAHSLLFSRILYESDFPSRIYDRDCSARGQKDIVKFQGITRNYHLAPLAKRFPL